MKKQKSVAIDNSGGPTPALRLEYWEPEKLNDHPLNWKKHPESQTKPLRELIDGVGWAGAALVNERTGKMLDGHARKKITRPGEKVPVLVGSWTEVQEKLILATLDPIGALAETDTAQLDALIREIDTGDPAIMEMIARLAEENGIVPQQDVEEVQAPDDFKEVDENIETEHTCPKCGYAWSGGH